MTISLQSGFKRALHYTDVNRSEPGILKADPCKQIRRLCGKHKGVNLSQPFLVLRFLVSGVGVSLCDGPLQ